MSKSYMKNFYIAGQKNEFPDNTIYSFLLYAEDNINLASSLKRKVYKSGIYICNIEYVIWNQSFPLFIILLKKKKIEMKNCVSFSTFEDFVLKWTEKFYSYNL